MRGDQGVVGAPGHTSGIRSGTLLDNNSPGVFRHGLSVPC